MALQVLAANNAQEDYGIYFIGGLTSWETTELSTLTIEIDEEIDKLKK